MPTKQEFLEEKATNFRNYLMQFQPSEEVVTYADSFSKESLIPTILTKLVPIVSTNSQDSVADSLLEKLIVKEEQKQTVKEKILAYFNCFYSIVMND